MLIVSGARIRTRTENLLLTRQLLCQLSYSGVAPQVGLEPTTYRLTAERSTIELLRIVNGRRDRIRTYGLCAPNAPRYQTAPLSDVLVPMAGVEPAWAMPDRF